MIREFEIVYSGETLTKEMETDALIFSFESFYIARYIQRHLRRTPKLKEITKSREKADRIYRLAVGINFKKEEFKDFSSSNGLFYQSTFNYTDIKNLNTAKRADKLLEVIIQALPSFETNIKGITEIITNIIKKFKEDNYINKWEYAKRRIKGVGSVRLINELTPLRFYLKMIIEDKNQNTLYSKTLLETMPDSLCYHHRYKSLTVTDDTIIVSQRISEDKAFFSISIQDALQKGIDNKVFKQGIIPKYWVEFESHLLSC